MAENFYEMDVTAYLLKKEYDGGRLRFDQVEAAGQALSSYYERARAQKRQPFSALTEARETEGQKVRDMYRTKADPSEVDEDRNAEMQALISPLPYTGATRRQIANVAQFAHDSGEDVETVGANYPLFRDGYVRVEMGRDAATDDEVYEHIGARHDLKDHLTANARQAGVLGQRPSKAFWNWARQAKKEKLKGLQFEEMAEYEKLFRDEQQKARTMVESFIPAAQVLSNVPGAGYLEALKPPAPLLKGADESLALAGGDGETPQVVARRDAHGYTVTDMHEMDRVLEQAGGVPVYRPNETLSAAQKRDESEAARMGPRVERVGSPGMRPILDAPDGMEMVRPYAFDTRTVEATTEVNQSRAAKQQHYLAEAKRQGAFLETLQTEYRERRIEISQQLQQDDTARNNKLQELRVDIEKRYEKHLEEKQELLLGAHDDFENGLLSGQDYRQVGVELRLGDLVGAYQEEVAMKERDVRALDMAKRAALEQDAGETPHVMITPEYREAYAKALSEPSRIVYQVGRGRGSKAFEGKTSQEVEEIARRWKGSPIVEVDTVEKRLAVIAKQFAPQIAESHQRMREALGPLLDDDEDLIAAYESRALFDTAGELPKGVVELLLNPRFWGERTPWVGGFVEMGYLASVAGTAEKLMTGGEVSDGERVMLREALIEMRRPNTWWGQVLDFSVSSASFGVELGTSGGMATAAKKGAMEVAGLGLRRLATVEGRQALEKHLGMRVLSGTLDVAARTATGSASRVFERAFTEQHFNHLEMEQGPDGKVMIGLEAGYEPGSMWDKLPGAFMHQMVENGSEGLGAFMKFPGAAKALKEMTAPAREAVAKQALFKAFAQKMGSEKAARYLARANERLAKMQIHGIPQEIAEEYAAALGHTVFEGEEFSPPSFDDITALMASMVLSRGGAMARDGVLGNNTEPDADIWKPVTGGGIYEVEEPGGAQGANGTDSPAADAPARLSFSEANTPRAGGEDVNALADTFEMLRTDETSRRGAAVPDKDLNVILQTMASRTETPENVRVDPNPPMRPETERSYVVTINEGGEVVVNVEKNRTVWVDTQGVRGGAAPRKAQGGDLVYQGGLNYAHSNGLVFVPDPREVTPVAQRRRISHMASSALRHGTTRHFNPYHANDKYNTELPPRSEWREEKTEADYKHNLNLLLRAELNYVDRQMKDRGTSLDNLRYDPNTDTVWQKQGGTDGGPSDWRQLTEDDFSSLVQRLDPGRSGVGETTLARALLAKVRLEGHELGQRLTEHHGSETSDGGREVTPQSGARLYRLRGTAEAPNKLFYSRGESSGSARVQRTGVTQAETTAAEARLKSTAQGRAIYGNVLIVDNRAALDGLQGRPGQQRYHAEDWGIMQDAEGFHDPRDGTVVIFRENVRVLEGENAAQAMARVVVHERVGHHGFDALRESDSKFANIWSGLAQAIPQKEMEELEARYTHLKGNRDALALEWFAHRVGNMEGRAQLEPGSVAQRMWQAMSDWVVRRYNPLGEPGTQMSQEVIDAHVRGLIRATQRSMVKNAKNSSARTNGSVSRDTLLNTRTSQNGMVDGPELNFSMPGREIWAATLGDRVKNGEIFDHVRQNKRALINSPDEQTKFSKQKAFVNDLYDKNGGKKAYANRFTDRSKPILLLTMPSSSGANKLPLNLARRLQEDFKVEMINGDSIFGRDTDTQAKDAETYLEKMALPPYMIDDPVLADRLKGKRIILVDDLITTGDSGEALRTTLLQMGVDVESMAVLGTSPNAVPATDATRKALHDELGRQLQSSSTLPPRIKELLNQKDGLATLIQEAHRRSLNSLLKKAKDDANSPNGAVAVVEAMMRRRDTWKKASTQEQ